MMTGQAAQAPSDATPRIWARRWQVAALVASAGLVVIVALWQLWPSATVGGVLTALLLSVPALLPLPGIASRNRYTYKWATLCVAPYFVVGLTETIANPETRWWAASVLVVALGWFIALVGFLRATRAE